jgi:di/tripeptidase
MSLGHIYYRGLSIQRFRISAEGPGGHSWIHNNRPSAIHVLVKISDALLRLELSEQPKSTLNIGLFHGGTTINSIAGKAYIELDLRSETQARLEDLVLVVNEVISSSEVKDVTLILEGIGERPGGSLDLDHPLLRAAKQALNFIGVRDIQLEIGSTDANVPLSMGLPAICIGLTRGGGAHSLEEYIEIPPITQGYDALLKTIELAFNAG